MKSLCSLLLVATLAAGCSQKSDNTTPGGTANSTPASPSTSTANGTDPGAAFLADNGKKSGVVTTASGLQYSVTKSGTGASPKATDTVKVNYEGKLIDGTIFDSSYQRGEPASFPVNQVIPGWTEALQLMKVGDEWELFIPAKLAYGENSPSPTIPPNSVLIFKVELLDIQK